MPVCSYVVFPRTGRSDPLARTLAAMEGCTVEVAENKELLLLVTETDGPAADRALRERVESEPDIECLVMAFGEIDPETELRDPVKEARTAEGDRRSLPVLSGEGPAPGPASGSGSGWGWVSGRGTTTGTGAEPGSGTGVGSGSGAESAGEES